MVKLELSRFEIFSINKLFFSFLMFHKKILMHLTLMENKSLIFGAIGFMLVKSEPFISKEP